MKPSRPFQRLVLMLALLGVGCHGPQNVLAPAGPGARTLAYLGNIALISFSLATLVTWALLGFVVLRRRGSLQEHERPDVGGGQGWLWIGGVLIPVVTFGSLFVLTLEKVDDFPLHDDEHHAPEVRVIGHQWWWEVEYLGASPHLRLTTANELHIPVGQPVQIQLESRDVIHSFWVPQLHGKVDLVPGWTNHLRLQADAPGRYQGECAEFCGAQHARMRLLVVAEAPEDYARWVRQQTLAASVPTEPVALAGRELFESRACGLCHTVRGTSARGSVGPDLTHLASRQGIAANSFPNSHAYLAAWAVGAQTLKPEVAMPNVNDFDGQELEELVTFLEGLK
jgi:cytochrome c oxidase subunit 2